MRSWVSARSFCSSTALSTGDRTGGAGSGVTRGGGGGGAGGRGADGTGRRGSGGGGTARGGATGSGSGARTAGSSAGGASTTGSGCEVGVACTSSGGEGVNHPLIVAHPSWQGTLPIKGAGTSPSAPEGKPDGHRGALSYLAAHVDGPVVHLYYSVNDREADARAI